MIGKSRSSGRYSAAVAKEIKESALNVPPGMVDISCWPYLTMVAAMDFGQQMNTRLPMVSFFLHFRTCFIPEHSC